MAIISILTFSLLLYYCFFFYKTYLGILSLKKIKPLNIENKLFSIIIAARNEEQNIDRLLTSLTNLDYPKNCFEIIIIDDRSSDLTSEKILAFKDKLINVQLITLLENTAISPKKFALNIGINLAKNDIIVCTDADCEVPPTWLSELNKFYNGAADVVCGPVAYFPKKDFLSKIIACDFASLIAFGAGQIGIKQPIICNGANFSYKKNAYQTVNGFTGIDSIASGDDDLLLKKFSDDKKNINYSWSSKSLVKTEAPKNGTEFYNQRLRWSSKGLTHHSNVWKYKFITLGIFYLSIVLLNLVGLFNYNFFVLGLYLVILKLFIDYLIFKEIRNLYQEINFITFLITSILQIPYVIFFAIVSKFKTGKWK